MEIHIPSVVVDISDRVQLIAYPSLGRCVLINHRLIAKDGWATSWSMAKLETVLRERQRERQRAGEDG
jgi:Flp pilus assembly protein TadB